MIEVIMPKAGIDMQEGTIVSWFKKEGEKVSTGEPILEIITDKVNMEVESEGDGILAVITHDTEGEVLPVFTVIGAIAEKGEDPADIKAKLLSNTYEKSTSKQENIEEVKKEAVADKKDSKYDYDVVVVGGGPAGYVAAIKAAMLGGKVAIVEEDKFGGTCLNRGCIPTKTYMENVEVLETLKEFEKRGLEVKIEKQDIKKSVKYKKRVVKKLVAGVEGLLKSQGVTLFKAKATVKKANEVLLDDGKKLSTENIIIATGSKPSVNSNRINSDLVLTSTEALDLEEVPEEIIIVGGDFIGCEFAEIFNSRGSKVTIVEANENILLDIDEEIRNDLKDIFDKKGIKIELNKQLEKIVEDNSQVIVKLSNSEEIKADKVLLSLGRECNLNGIEDLNLKLKNNAIVVNSKMETSIPSIYAVGDVTGIDMTAHIAFQMGEIAAKNIMGIVTELDKSASPKCLYTVPQVASIGFTEEEAKNKYNIKVGKFSFGANGKALAESSTDGYIKIIAEEKYGEILGVHMIGSAVTELINEASILKVLEVPVDEGAELIFAHPTKSEVLKEALADVYNSSIHTPKK